MKRKKKKKRRGRGRNRNTYGQPEIFMVLFFSQEPTAFSTHSICFSADRPSTSQVKQSMLSCHLSMRSTSTIEACHLAYQLDVFIHRPSAPLRDTEAANVNMNKCLFFYKKCQTQDSARMTPGIPTDVSYKALKE